MVYHLHLLIYSQESFADLDGSVWNFAGAKSLVIVTANAPITPGQRLDIEILDGSAKGNVYLSKKVSQYAHSEQN